MKYFFLNVPLAALLLARATAADLPRVMPPTAPVSPDPAVVVSLFAHEPMIRQPTGIAFTREGKLLAIQSNTHNRPKHYVGPTHDRILWLDDADGDGRAEKAHVFFEGTDLTMDIATASDGSIYVATRNEIFRLHDDDRDGKADRVDRRLVFLDTVARYPHNAISGLAFDGQGGLFFGMGENSRLNPGMDKAPAPGRSMVGTSAQSISVSLL